MADTQFSVEDLRGGSAGKHVRNMMNEGGGIRGSGGGCQNDSLIETNGVFLENPVKELHLEASVVQGDMINNNNIINNNNNNNAMAMSCQSINSPGKNYFSPRFEEGTAFVHRQKSSHLISLLPEPSQSSMQIDLQSQQLQLQSQRYQEPVSSGIGKRGQQSPTPVGSKRFRFPYSYELNASGSQNRETDRLGNISSEYLTKNPLMFRSPVKDSMNFLSKNLASSSQQGENEKHGQQQQQQLFMSGSTKVALSKHQFLQDQTVGGTAGVPATVTASLATGSAGLVGASSALNSNGETTLRGIGEISDQQYSLYPSKFKQQKQQAISIPAGGVDENGAACDVKEESLEQQGRQIIVTQVFGMFVEFLVIFRRGINGDNVVFLVLGLLSVLAEITAIIPIIARLDNIRSGKNLSVRSMMLIGFVCSQILRAGVFLSRYSENNSTSIEIIIQIFFIVSLSSNVVGNCEQIVKLKEKLILSNQCIVIYAVFNALDYSMDNLKYQLMAAAALVVFMLIITMYFNSFLPFGRCAQLNQQQVSKQQQQLQQNSKHVILTTGTLIKDDEDGRNYQESKVKRNTQQQQLQFEDQLSKLESNVGGAWKLHRDRVDLTEIRMRSRQIKRIARATIVSAVIDTKLATAHVSKGLEKLILSAWCGSIGETFDDDDEKERNDRTCDVMEKLVKAICIETVDKNTQRALDQCNSNSNPNSESSSKAIVSMFSFVDMVGGATSKEQQLLQPQTPQMQNQHSGTSQGNTADQVKIQSSQLSVIQELSQQNSQQNQSQAQQNQLIQQQQQYQQQLSSLGQIQQDQGNDDNMLTSTYSSAQQKFDSKKIHLVNQKLNKLESKLSLSEFLGLTLKHERVFGQFGLEKPMTISGFSVANGNTADENISKIVKWISQRYQIKIYPVWRRHEQDWLPTLEGKSFSESIVPITQSHKYEMVQSQRSEECENSMGFLIVFEEIESMSRVVVKAQMESFMKSIYGSINADLNRSLKRIYGITQSSLLSKRIPREIKEKVVQPIQFACKAMKMNAYNFRDYSSIMDGRFELCVKEACTPQIVEDSALLFNSFRSQSVRFSVEIDEDVPILIQTDSQRLIQVILSLLSNAYRNVRSVSAGGEITLRVFFPSLSASSVMQQSNEFENNNNGNDNRLTESNYLRILVEDSGPAMSESESAHLRNRFSEGIPFDVESQQQQHQQAQQGHDSLGVNLFICNLIAKSLFQSYESPQQQQQQFIKSNTRSGIHFNSQNEKGNYFYFDISYYDLRAGGVGTGAGSKDDFDQVEELNESNNENEIEEELGKLPKIATQDFYSIQDGIIAFPAVTENMDVESEEEQMTVQHKNNEQQSIDVNQLPKEQIKVEENQVVEQQQQQAIWCQCSSAILVEKEAASTEAGRLFVKRLEREFGLKVTKKESMQSVSEDLNRVYVPSSSVCLCENKFQYIFVFVDGIWANHNTAADFESNFDDLIAKSMHFNEIRLKQIVLFGIVSEGPAKQIIDRKAKLHSNILQVFSSIEAFNQHAPLSANARYFQ